MIGRTCSLRTSCPAFEVLEDRTVPAMINLTTPGMSAAVNGYVFQQATTEPNIAADEFLRLHSLAGVSQGYNSNSAPQYDEIDSYTRRVFVADLPPITANGMQYRVVKLNIGDGGITIQSLDELRIYFSKSNLSGYNAATRKLGGVAPTFDLGDHFIKLNAALSPGKADMLLYVPAPPKGLLSGLLGGLLDTTSLYVYSKFGVTFSNPDGLEIWGAGAGVIPPPSPPPAGTASLSGFVYWDANGNGLYDDTNAGIRDVTLFLAGATDDGEAVEFTVETNQDGSFVFSGLKPGTYAIVQEQPFGYDQGTNTVGTIDGETIGELDTEVADRIFEIHLPTGKTGLHYNFGELLPSAPS